MVKVTLMLGHPFPVSPSTEWVSAVLRGARAEKRSWNSRPPSCELVLVFLLSSLSRLASGETCNTHRSDGRQAPQLACFNAVAGLPHKYHNL
eukprot:3058490-Pyramimonas_sp.AAC.1